MKNAQPTIKAELSASEHGQYNVSRPFVGTKNPRQLRVIEALLRGPCSRSQIDAIAGASNGPEVIAQLRYRGLDIPCELVPVVDRDGLRVRHGMYRLTQGDLLKLADWKKSQSRIDLDGAE